MSKSIYDERQMMARVTISIQAYEEFKDAERELKTVKEELARQRETCAQLVGRVQELRDALGQKKRNGKEEGIESLN